MQARLKNFDSSRPLDVTAIENALVDLLVRGDDASVSQLGLTKGTMKLVESDEQRTILEKIGDLHTEIELGGSAANALRGMATLGAKTSYSSAIGNDSYGSQFAKRMTEIGIINRLSTIELGAHTGTCLVVVTPDGERTLNTHLGACRIYTKPFVPVDDIAKSKIFFTTGYVWDTPNQIEAIEFAVAEAVRQKTLVALDVADPFVVSRSGDVIHRHMKNGHIDILFANAEEAHMLVGCKGADAAKIIGQSVPLAVVKDGAHGAYVWFNGEVIHIPTTPVKPVDTTGAGDMFAGGFLYGLVKGYSIELAGKIAVTLAGDTILHMGVRLSKDIIERVRKIELA